MLQIVACSRVSPHPRGRSAGTAAGAGGSAPSPKPGSRQALCVSAESLVKTRVASQSRGAGRASASLGACVPEYGTHGNESLSLCLRSSQDVGHSVLL